MEIRCAICKNPAIVIANVNDGVEDDNFPLCESCLHSASKLGTVKVIFSSHPSYPVGYQENCVNESPDINEKQKTAPEVLCAVCKKQADLNARIIYKEREKEYCLCKSCFSRMKEHAEVHLIGYIRHQEPDRIVEAPITKVSDEPSPQTTPAEMNAQNTESKKSKNSKSKPVIVALVLLAVIIGGYAKHFKDNKQKRQEKTTYQTSSYTSSSSANKTDLDAARQTVINECKKDEPKVKTIEDIYKQYTTDPVIANLYYYATAKNQYSLYNSLKDDSFLITAKEYANKVDPDYKGVLSSEIQEEVYKILSKNQTSSKSDRKSDYEEANSEEQRYNALTNADKKEICDYIDSRYAYYDSLENGYSGDKYSDIIWEEAAKKFKLTTTHISIIWMNKYKY